MIVTVVNVLLMNTGSYFRRRRRSTICKPDITKFVNFPFRPSFVCRLDHRRRPGKHILETIFHQIWIKAPNMTWITFQMPKGSLLACCVPDFIFTAPSFYQFLINSCTCTVFFNSTSSKKVEANTIKNHEKRKTGISTPPWCNCFWMESRGYITRWSESWADAPLIATFVF